MRTAVKRTLAALFIFTLTCLSGAPVFAATSNNSTKGLLISPATNFLSVNAGSTKTGNLFVANYTSNSLLVNLEVEQFNVNDYSYSYTFNSNAGSNWITLSQDQITLTPNQGENIPYTIKTPSSAKPGGYYLTLIASGVLGSGSIKSTARVASLMYLTINGNLTYSSAIKGYGANRISFDRTVNYHFNVIDTGNIYSFIYESANLNGLFGKSSTTPIAHLVMPGKIRSVSGSITTPEWPGLYKVSYGYTINGGAQHQINQIVLFTPPWFIALILAALLVLNVYIGKRKLAKKDGDPSSHS